MRNSRSLYPCALLLLLSLVDIRAVLAAEETCGLVADTFHDGFEAGGLPPITPPNPQASLALTLDEGFDGRIVNARRLALSGTFDGPPTTGVGARDRPARLVGRRWLIPDVPLDPGPNAIRVAATTINGAKIERTLTIIRDDTLPPAPEWQATAAPGFAPIGARFTLSLPAEVRAQRLRIDFDGDGRDEVDTRQVESVFTTRFDVPGFYRARIIIDRVAGQAPTPITLTTPVLVEHLDEVRLSQCAAFGAMRGALIANDIPGALKALHPRLQADFTTLWNSLGTRLPTVATQLGTLASGTVSSDGFAEWLILRPDPGHTGEFMGYRVQFDRGNDGVWRIGSM